MTIAFCKFSHTDALLESGQGALLGERLERLAATVAAAEAKFGVHWLGSDVYPDGGKLILTAGAPAFTRRRRRAHVARDPLRAR